MMKHANSRLTTTTTPQAALLLTMTILAGLVFFQESSKPSGAKSAGNRFQNHKHTHILSPLPYQAHSTAVSLQNGVSPPVPVVWNTARELHATHTHHGNKADSFRRAAAANEPRDLRPPWQA